MRTHINHENENSGDNMRSYFSSEMSHSMMFHQPFIEFLNFFPERARKLYLQNISNFHN